MVITFGFQPEDDSSILSSRSGVCGNPRICDEHIPTICCHSEEVNTYHFLWWGEGSIPSGSTKLERPLFTTSSAKKVNTRLRYTRNNNILTTWNRQVIGGTCTKAWRKTLAMFLWWVRFPLSPQARQVNSLIDFTDLTTRNRRAFWSIGEKVSYLTVTQKSTERYRHRPLYKLR